MTMTTTVPVDTVIVGAGSAGGVLSARLSEDSARTVLLLESGPDFGPEPDGYPADVTDAADVGPTDWDWGLQAALGALGRDSPVFAGRLVGGSSATNNVMALRGRPRDYDGWAAAGNKGWGYDEVLDAFVRVENDLDYGDRPGHGEAGPVPIQRYALDELPGPQRAFVDTCVAAGHPPVADHNAPDAVGAGPLPLNVLGDVRQSTALTYLADARRRPNLAVWSDTTVDRVLVEGDRAAGVLLADGRVVPAGQVILAAGTYGSPVILQRSGIGPAAYLRSLGIPVRRDLPGVGANLHDHPLLRMRYGTGVTPEALPCQTVLTTRSDGAAADPDLQIFPSAVAQGEAGPELTLLVALLAPRSRGSVRLASPHPDDRPVIDVGLLNHPDDLARLRSGVRQARQLARTPPFADLLDAALWPGPDVGEDDEIDEAIRAGINVYQHPVGTCRMGPEGDPGAVVDADGRVHGLAGLAVIDASIMPTIPEANTNLPTLMIAERLAPYYV